MRLAGRVHHTPVLTSRTLDRELGAEVFLKAECLQRAGAFKIRGATNAVLQLAARGVAAVATYSSGNHAQALALAAHEAGLACTVLMPSDAPAAKLAATRGYGAEVVTYDRFTEDREALAEALAEERGAALVPPFDDPMIVAGQGTAALELLEEVGGLDVLVAPIGGGGLLAGTALAAAAAAPGCAVVGVEPQVRRAARDALARGAPVVVDVPATICDGQQTARVGAVPFAVLSARGVRVVGVDDEAVADTVRFLATRAKVVVEPSGASALAAVRRGEVPGVAGCRVGVVLSGGNVDPGRLAALLAPGATSR